MKQHTYDYGTFLNRNNRFIAEVSVNGAIEAVHVPNTGRLPQLLKKGVKVQLRKSDEPHRKTRYSLIAVQKKGSWVNIDSQLPNKLVYEAIEKGIITQFQGYDHLQKEVSFGKSRFDIYYETTDVKGFIEVKGVTYAEEGIGMFPDVPTTRGTKHIYTLMDALKEGYEGTLLFLIMREECGAFQPHREMDPDFAEALKKASKKGVQILAYKVSYDETIPVVKEEVPVYIENDER